MRRAQLSLGRLLQIAWRDVRGGIGHFRVFIACIALGVMVISAVGGLSDGLSKGFEQQGKVILGGDVAIARMHAEASPAERRWLDNQGRVSATATMRTMVRLPDGSDQALVELKAIDAAYPLAGSVRLGSGAMLASTVLVPHGIAVEPLLLERLGLRLGDKIMLGKAELTINAVVEHEPDAIVDRLAYGPRVFISRATLDETGLAGPGALVRWRYALDLGGAGERGPQALIRLREALGKALPQAGFTVLDRRDPSPQVTRTIGRVREFLTLIGLTALLIGGVGVANAVATFVDRRRAVIATMKSLGATGGTIFGLFLAEVAAMAVLGVLIGLAGGLAAVAGLDAVFGQALPVPADFSVGARSLAPAVAYGLLVALGFALWPLGRAERVSAAVLFRDESVAERSWPRPRLIAAIVLIAAGLFALAILTSEVKRLALYVVMGIAAVLIAFYVLGLLVTLAARRLPRPRLPEAALAVGRLGAPGGLVSSVVLSLGAGLTLLVAVGLANVAVEREFATKLPDRSPDYFLLDIPRDEMDGLRAEIEGRVKTAAINEAPMLRGRLVALDDTPVDQVKAPVEAQWVLSGDRGLTYSDTVPQGSRVVAGTWWPADYDGEPLVSFDAKLAQRLGLKIGSRVTVNVLGRDVTARIANLRDVDWENLAINFVMVFSPNTLAGAPANLLATVSLPSDVSLREEAAVAREIGRDHPTVTVIRVKDAIAAIAGILGKVLTAVHVAGGITLIAGALVLAGALATAQRRRILETAILKALGATRRRVLVSHFAEYAALAAVTGVLAVALGSAIAWLALTRVMDLPFVFSWSAVLEALGLALVLVAVLGGMGTWRVLAAPAVPYLRSA